MNWKTEGRPWRMEGIRHAQLLGMNSVPNVVQDALKAAASAIGRHGRRKERGLHNVTGVPEGVVQSRQLGTVCRVGELGDQHGRGVGSERQTETNKETVITGSIPNIKREDHTRKIRTEQQ